MEVGDMVRHTASSQSVPCEVLEVKDLGHGEGNERVQVLLYGTLTKYYASKELVLIGKK